MAGLHIDSDWRRVFNTVRTKANLSIQRLSSRNWNFIEQLLKEYNRAIARAMGSVDAYGSRKGYPLIEYRDPFGGEEYSERVEWKPLSPFTVAHKANVLFGEDYPMTQAGAIAAWDDYAEDVSIWHFEGNAQGALDYNVRKGWAGISDSEVASYALKVEKGGPSTDGKNPIPARPLFAVMNEAFKHYLRDALSHSKTPLRKAMVREFKQSGFWDK